MAKKMEDLMQALVAKLYATITGDNPEIQMPRNKFVTWMLPGIPFSPKDFKFCSKGFSGETGEETLELYHQAFVLSKLFDFVPDVSNEFLTDDMQQQLFTTTQDTISAIYNDVLTYSKVVNIEPTEEQKAKMQKYRDLMSVTKVNEVTGKPMTLPGPVEIAYLTKMNEFLMAAEKYTNLLIDAQSAKGSEPEAIRRVAAFANQEKFLVRSMEAARMAWISQGYMKEYEAMNAYIESVTQRSMVLYKADLLKKFSSSVLSSPGDGGLQFRYTTLLPGNFAESTAWTDFSFYESDLEEHSKKNTSQWGTSGSAGFLGFGAKASAQGSKEKKSLDVQCSNFKASFMFTQVQICRPFFEQGFFSMHGWTLDKLWNLNYNNMPVSDGQPKPSGRLVAYSTSALFVKDVKFEFDEAKSHFESNKEALSGSGGANYALFNASGSYSKNSEVINRSASVSGKTLKIDGMQLIGYINNLIPKSPDTNPEIKPEDFV